MKAGFLRGREHSIGACRAVGNTLGAFSRVGGDDIFLMFLENRHFSVKEWLTDVPLKVEHSIHFRIVGFICLLLWKKGRKIIFGNRMRPHSIMAVKIEIFNFYAWIIGKTVK